MQNANLRFSISEMEYNYNQPDGSKGLLQQALMGRIRHDKSRNKDQLLITEPIPAWQIYARIVIHLDP